LPVPGQILVRPGDKVEAMDIIARALSPGRLYAVDAARALGVGNPALTRYMLKTEGEDVQADEVLAARKGLLSKRCVSPVSGTIRSVAQGRILVEREPLTIELRSYVRGEVARLIPNMGAIIRTTGALLRGAWGTDQEAYGTIRVVAEDRDQILTEDLLDASCHGAIVVGGANVTEAALELAEEVSVRGVVVGGMDSSLIDLAESRSFPVIVMQELGHSPMLYDTFQLFKLHQGRESVIMRRASVRGLSRPEILISLPGDQEAPPLEDLEAVALGPGCRVQLTRPPYVGFAGVVLDEPGMVIDADSSLQFRGVAVRLDDGRDIVAPVTNLALIVGSESSPVA
jgi:hypothetical protein